MAFSPPFGMLMPERSVGSANYRYLFNGMEVDNEVSGNGNSYTTEFRQYDPRLGRWKSLDPLMHQFPWMSPYVAFDNNPIYYTDPFGLCTDCEEGGEEPDMGMTDDEQRQLRKDGFLGDDKPGEFRKGEEGNYRWEAGDIYYQKEEGVLTPYVRHGNQKEGAWEIKTAHKSQDIKEIIVTAKARKTFSTIEEAAMAWAKEYGRNGSKMQEKYEQGAQIFKVGERQFVIGSTVRSPINLPHEVDAGKSKYSGLSRDDVVAIVHTHIRYSEDGNLFSNYGGDMDVGRHRGIFIYMAGTNGILQRFTAEGIEGAIRDKQEYLDSYTTPIKFKGVLKVKTKKYNKVNTFGQ